MKHPPKKKRRPAAKPNDAKLLKTPDNHPSAPSYQSERASAWIHDSIAFIERQLLGDILRETDERCLLARLNPQPSWTITRFSEIAQEVSDKWTTDIPDLHQKLDRDEIWNIRLDDECLDSAALHSLHGNFRSLIARL